MPSFKRKASVANGQERGQVFILMTFALVAVMGSVALAVDMGYMEHQKTKMQSAADGAAIAGASALAGGSSLITAAADEDASLNGFTNGSNGTTVTVNNPPKSGPNTGNSSYVEVIISQPQNTFFLKALKFKQITVGARAVAQVESAAGCVYALDTSASLAVNLSNGVNITSSCGVIVDSSSSSGLSVIGGAKLTTTSVGVAGSSYAMNNGGSIIKYSSGGSLTPVTGMIAVPDPLATVPEPTVGGCTYTGTQTYNSYTATQTPPYSGKYSISPGTYCGGIQASNGISITFGSGTYILAGGGMSLQNGGGTTTGTNVTFYNTTGSAAGYTGSNNAYAGINIANGVTATFSAPTSGTLSGILFFQDRSVPKGSAASTFAGGTSDTLTGALYFPTTQLNYSNGANAAYTILVADTLTFTGGATMNNNYTSLANGSPIVAERLTE
ncbi:MAG TPA: pilus assembly protein TadG-related protein [Candidatus Binataceae bacterium]|nr:pilus assembly protein TadG-related protein [Candidatus Binataceae bacterium]